MPLSAPYECCPRVLLAGIPLFDLSSPMVADKGALLCKAHGGGLRRRAVRRGQSVAGRASAAQPKNGMPGSRPPHRPQPPLPDEGPDPVQLLMGTCVQS